MEKQRLKIKRNSNGFLGKLFTDRKYRYLSMFLMMLPFIIAIGIFGFIAYKESKGLMSLASGNTETKNENLISSMEYVLRDNATDLQKEYFAQLKSAVEDEPTEGAGPVDDLKLAELVAKNYVADFYTWTNKQGQFDIGGMYYIFDGRFENNDHYKENVYLAARDGFYKYISTYMTQYGADKLLEVENVEITSSQKAPWKYALNEHVAYKQDAEGEWYDYREDSYFDTYLVSCKWTYKEGSSLNLSQFPTSINLCIIRNNNRLEMIEASESKINERVKTQTEDIESDEESEG